MAWDAAAKKAYQHDWYLRHREERRAKEKALRAAETPEQSVERIARDRASRRKQYAKNPVPKLASEAVRRQRVRAELLAEYGGQCACCAEATPEFLAVDHTNGDGSKHRREIGVKAGFAFALWLRRNHYPKEGFRLLCHNCNSARGYYGYCPHERTQSPSA